MEEGGKDSATESAIIKRLELWKARDSKDVENAPEFYGELDYASEWFDPNPKSQSTWRQLIRIFLYAKQRAVSEKHILLIQADDWGRPESESAIFEMFSLPARGIKDWPYPNFCDAWFLKSRGIYTHSFYNLRANYIQQKIKDHQPQCLVFYGTTYDFLFEGLIRQSFEKTELSGLKISNFGQTPCFLVRHPTAWNGVSDDYFESVGRYISKFIG